SSMGDLLSALIICNCENASESFRLNQETRRSEEWLTFALQIAAGGLCPEPLNSPSSSPDVQRIPESVEIATWGTIEISFLSDERVQIRNGKKTETYNYAELGFADQRNGTPTQAWGALRILAERGGCIKDP